MSLAESLIDQLIYEKLIQVTPGKFAVVLAKADGEHLEKEFGDNSSAMSFARKKITQYAKDGIKKPKDYIVVLYTPKSGSPARQVLWSRTVSQARKEK